MNTSFFLNKKRLFFTSEKKTLKKNINTSKPEIIYIILIVFTSFLGAGCNGNNSTKENKTDTVFIQQNNQGGEGMDGNHGGMDSMRRGMGHNGMGPNGMDTSHRKRHE